MTRPAVIDRLTVEVLQVPDDAPRGFRLNRDRLGTGRLGALNANAAEWVPVLAQARSVRIARGGDRDGVAFSPSVGTLTLTAVDAPSLDKVRPATPIRVRELDGPALFTGVVNDIHTSWERVGQDVAAVRTITATDAVQDLANTTRHGVGLGTNWPWQSFETLGQRAARLLAGTTLPYVAPTPMATDWVTMETYDRWDTQGAFAYGYPADETGPGLMGFRWEQGDVYADAAILAQLDLPASYPATIEAGLWVRLESPTPTTPGQVRLWLRSPGELYAFTDHDLPADGRWHHLTVTGTVTGDNGGLYVQLGALSFTTAPAGGSGLSATGLTVSSSGCQGAAYALGPLVYESTLANHLDLAVNSTRGAWWVDASGFVQVRGCRHHHDATPLALSDAPGAALSYVSLTHDHDTAGMVNELTLENHGRKPDPDNPGSHVADDRTLGPFRDWTSVADYGPRAASVSTGLVYPDRAAPMWIDAADRLARAYLSTAASAEPRPSQVRIYHDPAKPAFPPIDVMGPVDLTWRGTTYPCVVASIDHDIDPTSWHTTLTLMERT